jgi:hypothetical protein
MYILLDFLFYWHPKRTNYSISLATHLVSSFPLQDNAKRYPTLIVAICPAAAADPITLPIRPNAVA